MSYDYKLERPKLFTEDGVKRLMKVRDKVKSLLKTAGAFRLAEAGIFEWEDMACIEYLVELGELIEFRRDCWGQFRVFTTPQIQNR